MTDSAENNQTLKNLCLEQPLAVLSTACGTAPYANLVAVVFTNDLRQLYFTTPRATHKYDNLSNNRQVALLIDNRSNQVVDFSQATAATVIGFAEELTGEQKASGLKLYLSRHPHLAAFTASTECAFFTVRIQKINMVNGFNNVISFDFTE